TAPEGGEAYFRLPETLARLERPSVTGDFTRIGSQYIVSLPIIGPDQALGMLHVGIDVGFVDKIVQDMWFDVLVVLVVALFFTFELLNFIAGSRLEAGLKSIAAVLERGGRGDFTRTPVATSDLAFGGVRLLLENAITRVNAEFSALTRDIEAASHQAAERISAATAGLQDLKGRLRFGQTASESSDTGLLNGVRAPLFGFLLAEELTRPFLPSFVKSVMVPIPGVSPQIVVGLPIVLFMLIVALGQPYFGALSERIGNRRMMIYGAAIAAAGFATTALSVTVFDLLLWRAFCALGYALVFVSAQGLILSYTTAETRARGFALFVGAFMVATVCGPSIGGILADNIGERPTFMISAVLAAASILLIRLLPGDVERDPSKPVIMVPRFFEVRSLVFNRNFMTLTGLAAVPAKILLTGVCFYLVPLYVVSIGTTPAMAGRILMTYAVVMVLMAPLVSPLANNRDNREWLVAGGLCLSGIGGLLLLLGGSVPWVFAAVLIIGFGQSLSITAQSALVSDHCKQEMARMGDQTVYGVYRLVERLGNAAGPLIASALVIVLGYENSFVAIGAFVLTSGIAFTLLVRAGHRQARVTAE
ncbi:MAG: MFS transporter, partial [Proteobacteria bacterium]|nr:MFS transporter [Pseudomonadota bacterium]